MFWEGSGAAQDRGGGVVVEEHLGHPLLFDLPRLRVSGCGRCSIGQVCVCDLLSSTLSTINWGMLFALIALYGKTLFLQRRCKTDTAETKISCRCKDVQAVPRYHQSSSCLLELYI